MRDKTPKRTVVLGEDGKGRTIYYVTVNNQRYAVKALTMPEARQIATDYAKEGTT